MTSKITPSPQESNALEKGLDLYTTVLDSVLSSNALETVPGLGMLLGAGKAYLAIKDALFIKKLENFLTNVGSIPHKEKDKFIRKLDEEPAYKQLVIENILLLIDRLDDMEKTTLAGELLKAHMKSLINYDTYRRYSSIIDRAHIADLKAFLKSTGSIIITDLEFTETELAALDALGITKGLTGMGFDKEDKELEDIRIIKPNYKDGESLYVSYISEVGTELRRLLKHST